MIKLNPYINFKNNAREAIEFYKSVFGGELTVSTFKDGGMVQDGPESELIMHAMLIVGPEMTIMASDTPEHMEYKPAGGISMSLSGENSDEEKLKAYWDKLLEGGNAFMPINKAPWGDTFGMLTDKFGINWMVNIAGKKE
ncbi:MAG TPA: VOC family protein [Candidatus Saccharimonadales bacterium]|nr:VOC family protein [Candidatus Saccharimonadales bacterium]